MKIGAVQWVQVVEKKALGIENLLFLSDNGGFFSYEQTLPKYMCSIQHTFWSFCYHVHVLASCELCFFAIQAHKA